jgi:transposase
MNKDNITVKNVEMIKQTEKCPECSFVSKRQSTGTRKIKDIGSDGRSVILNVKFSKHRCIPCGKIFSLPMKDIAHQGSRFSNKIRKISIDLVQNKEMTFEGASKHMRSKYQIKVPMSTIHDWVVEDCY